MKYFAIIDDKQQGPFDLNELADRGIDPDTYVWCKTMPDWDKARNVADICRFYRNRIFDLMHPDQNDKAADSPTMQQNNLTDPLVVNKQGRILGIEYKINVEERPEQLDKKPALNLTMILFTIICFPPTGIAALYNAQKCMKQWKSGNKAESHEYARKAEMLSGMSFFLGLILYTILFIIL